MFLNRDFGNPSQVLEMARDNIESRLLMKQTPLFCQLALTGYGEVVRREGQASELRRIYSLFNIVESQTDETFTHYEIRKEDTVLKELRLLKREDPRIVSEKLSALYMVELLRDGNQTKCMGDLNSNTELHAFLGLIEEFYYKVKKEKKVELSFTDRTFIFLEHYFIEKTPSRETSYHYSPGKNNFIYIVGTYFLSAFWNRYYITPNSNFNLLDGTNELPLHGKMRVKSTLQSDILFAVMDTLLFNRKHPHDVSLMYDKRHLVNLAMGINNIDFESTEVTNLNFVGEKVFTTTLKLSYGKIIHNVRGYDIATGQSFMGSGGVKETIGMSHVEVKRLLCEYYPTYHLKYKDPTYI